jgi:hypothetical protein
LTKHIHDPLTAAVDDLKVEVCPKLIDNTHVIAPQVLPKPETKVKARMEKAKVTNKKTQIEKATSHLYDLENNSGPEKTLNINFGLYQMEDY